MKMRSFSVYSIPLLSFVRERIVGIKDCVLGDEVLEFEAVEDTDLGKDFVNCWQG